MRWLFAASLLLATVGYFGPWVNHPVAGLVITGLDLGEYVKFLPVVRDGVVTIWRVGFYSPLVAISATTSLHAFRREASFPLGLSFPLLALAIVTALNLVPPAWTPARLLEPEFRLQTASLLCMVILVAIAPLLALLPRQFAATFSTLLLLLGVAAPLHGFFQVLPAIGELYNQPLTPGWGLWLMCVAVMLSLITLWQPWQATRPAHSPHPRK